MSVFSDWVKPWNLSISKLRNNLFKGITFKCLFYNLKFCAATIDTHSWPNLGNNLGLLGWTAF